MTVITTVLTPQVPIQSTNNSYLSKLTISDTCIIYIYIYIYIYNPDLVPSENS